MLRFVIVNWQKKWFFPLKSYKSGVMYILQQEQSPDGLLKKNTIPDMLEIDWFDWSAT